jgi:hypothetical protein
VTNDRIGRYARGYAEIARIQATFAKILAAHGIDPSLETFEADVLLDRDVVERAARRADGQGVDLAAIVRATLFQAAAEAIPDPQYDPARRPPFRPKPERGRARLRFWVPREPYDEAKQAILASRRSVAHALEDRLRIYAEEGRSEEEGPEEAPSEVHESVLPELRGSGVGCPANGHRPGAGLPLRPASPGDLAHHQQSVNRGSDA